MGVGVTDIAELVEKAKIVAEATGRDEADVLEDLLDDGIVNESNKEKDLVTQLKEAAELITTVQAINKDVSENTVLNGGENKTEVTIETTLEGDIVDRAIESIQRKSENIKKLLITMTPLFLLITGGGLEALGVIDVMDSENEGDYEISIDYGGCMAFDADNYDSMASWDDGTCYWEDNNGGGGGPPVNCQWVWEDNSYMDNGNFLVINAIFSSPNCPYEMEGDFYVELIKDGEYQIEGQKNGIWFKENYNLEHSFTGLESGVYKNHFRFEADNGSYWNWDSPQTHEVMDDNCYPQTELDNPIINADGNDLIVDLVFSDLGGCGQDIQINIEVWRGGQLHDTLDYGEVHDGIMWIEPNGDTLIRIEGKTELTNIPDGDEWTVKAKYRHANADSPFESDWFQSNVIVIDVVQDPIYGCTDSNATNYDSNATDDDSSCEYPPEICGINLYSISLSSNSTQASVYFDLDCGYNINNLSGYNVTVQFLVYELNGTNSGANATGPITYEVCTHYIEGWKADTIVLTLTNFTTNGVTNYDFYWYAMWIDGNGNGQIIEESWLNRELNP